MAAVAAANTLKKTAGQGGGLITRWMCGDARLFTCLVCWWKDIWAWACVRADQLVRSNFFFIIIFCTWRYPAIKNRTITRGTDNLVCKWTGGLRQPVSRRVRSLTNAFTIALTSTPGPGPVSAAARGRRRLGGGLLSHLQLWHSGCMVCRSMQSNAFLAHGCLSFAVRENKVFLFYFIIYFLSRDCCATVRHADKRSGEEPYQPEHRPRLKCPMRVYSLKYKYENK